MSLSTFIALLLFAVALGLSGAVHGHGGDCCLIEVRT
jgi:hypothetical protein